MQATTLCVSCGDVNGIGLECFFKALLDKHFVKAESFKVFCNVQTVLQTLLHFSIPFSQHSSETNTLVINDNTIELISLPIGASLDFGVVSRESAKVALSSLEAATDFLKSHVDIPLVTLPVNKASLHSIGFSFAGQTDYLAQAFFAPTATMILAFENIRVALTTVHTPLSEVAKLITTEVIEEKVVEIDSWLKSDLNIVLPRIAILGLNPHAGESGLLGTEELDVIQPAIVKLNERGYNVEGAFPADGFFAHKSFKNFDAILAQYHDQGLIPLKMMSSGAGVNVTAGLPIIRTSPDHGTAFDIAGKGIADFASTINAIDYALEFSSHRFP